MDLNKSVEQESEVLLFPQYCYCANYNTRLGKLSGAFSSVRMKLLRFESILADVNPVSRDVPINSKFICRSVGVDENPAGDLVHD